MLLYKLHLQLHRIEEVLDFFERRSRSFQHAVSNYAGNSGQLLSLGGILENENANLERCDFSVAQLCNRLCKWRHVLTIVWVSAEKRRPLITEA